MCKKGVGINRTELLFLLERFDESKIFNDEALQITEEVGRKDIIFSGKVLSAKIDFQLITNYEFVISQTRFGIENRRNIKKIQR